MVEDIPVVHPHNSKYASIADHGVFKFPITSSETTAFSKTNVLPFSNFEEDDPIWLPAKNWESLNRDNEEPLNSSGNNLSNFLLSHRSYNPFVISEESLVRLAINALNGIESSISTIDKLSAAFCSEITDRYIGISTLWSPCLSPHSLGKLLKCLGYSGRLVFILRRFSEYLTCSNFRSTSCENEVDDLGFTGTGLVNQAFGVALKKILQGYAAAFDTIHSSVGCSHHSSAMNPPPFVSSKAMGFACVVHSKMTILKVYLHTQELRNHISSTGSICNVTYDVLSSSDLSVEDLDHKCWLNFSNFPRGGELLTYLYTKFRNADRPQYDLLKFFFIQSCEPLCNFVRSWIYEAEIADPCGEFVGKNVKNHEHSPNFDYIDAVDLPCFLHGVMVPFLRAGKQLKIIRKLLQFCSYSATINEDFNWILPHWNMFSSSQLLFPFSLKLSMSKIREAEREMSDFYERLLNKIDDNSVKFNFSDQILFPISDKCTFCGEEATFSLPEMSESCESSISESYSTCSQDSYELELQNGTGGGDYSPACFEESYFSSLMQIKMTENGLLSQKSNFIGRTQSKTTDLERFLCSTDKATGFSTTGSPHENNQVIGRQDDHPWFFAHPQRNPFPFNNIGDGIGMMESLTNSMSFFHRVPDFSTTPKRNSDFISPKNNSECNFFDFSFVEDASITCIDKLSSKIVQNCENYPPPSHTDPVSDISLPNENEDSALPDYYKSENSYCTMVTNEKTTSGSSIEFESSVSLFYIPIDFVISKCFRQEILLQYKYVSKLAMKLFDEVFHLKEHLLTVRRYLFLEVADWVDIFTLSLCRCEWQNLEVKILTSMVQGMLEASLEKTSCRSDPNKARLYVYLKGDDITVSHKIGVHSFKFIALGYRSGWPVNTILSTSALEKYTEIFSFLLHLNIVTTSLNNVWASFSGMGFHRILSNMRYRVHHFVFTLQQHVQSQFKILWVTFIRFMECKIHDVMDLELTHIAYLNRALRVCFLTDETRRIRGIIEVIVQCAFDFGNLLHGIKWNKSGEIDIGACNGDLTQILKIWSEFNKGMRDLYMFCQQSSENVNFDMSCFWDQLDYNEYYINKH